MCVLTLDRGWTVDVNPHLYIQHRYRNSSPIEISDAFYYGLSERPSNSEVNRVSSASTMAMPSVGYPMLTTIYFNDSEVFIRSIKMVA